MALGRCMVALLRPWHWLLRSVFPAEQELLELMRTIKIGLGLPAEAEKYYMVACEAGLFKGLQL